MTSISHMRFRDSLYDPDDFTLTFELVPGRAGKGKGQNRILALARAAAEDGRIQAVSITDNAGGHPALTPEVLGLEIRAMGLDVINHFSCKDKNRNQMESLLFGWDRHGLNNLLVLSGDYPRHGYKGQAKPVFDLDSVQALDLISHMNQGVIDHHQKEPSKPFQPTTFLKGVAISPFKLLHSELELQYAKLLLKALAGADYIITQLGWDARKFHEIKQFLTLNGLDLPVLGNVFIPNLTVAKLMYKGEIPGCVITDSLYQRILKEGESADKGRQARLQRGAVLLAIQKGLGYAGAHIGGPGLTFDDLNFLISTAEEIGDDWREYLPEMNFWPERGAYFYRRDIRSGLNLPEETPQRQKRSPASPSYLFAKKSHHLLFEKDGALYPAMKKICLTMENQGLGDLLSCFEHLAKLAIFGCQNCGDCRLGDLAFLCPQSGCAKYLLNGPCGGSREGWCEVYPNKKRCFYVRVHERLAHLGQLLTTAKPEIKPPREWALNQTSSWLNFFHQQDR